MSDSHPDLSSTISGEFDSPWKEALEQYLESFLAFAFPDLHDLIDWEQGYRSFEGELQQVLRDAELGRCLADKFFEVQLRDRSIVYVLIHIEVQSQYKSDFEERMFIYNDRCRDRASFAPVEFSCPE